FSICQAKNAAENRKRPDSQSDLILTKMEEPGSSAKSIAGACPHTKRDEVPNTCRFSWGVRHCRRNNCDCPSARGLYWTRLAYTVFVRLWSSGHSLSNCNCDGAEHHKAREACRL